MAANVVLRSIENGQVVRAGFTDKDGIVNYADVEPGTYSLRISFVGYEAHVQDINIVRDKVVLERFSLSVAEGRLQGITVSAKREEAGNAGITRISGDDIATAPTPGAGGDLASYLQNVPGVVSVGDRGGGFYVRGGTPDENKVLVDGIPVVKPFHISNLFSAFPDKIISSVDLYSGGFNAEYYGVTSAVIDVNLRPGNYKAYEGGAAAGTYLSSFHIEGPIYNDNSSFLLMGRKSLINETASFWGDNHKPTDFYDFTARYSLKEQNFRCNVTAMHTYDEGQINPARSFDLSWSNTAAGLRCLGFSEALSFPVEYKAGFSRFDNDVSSDEATTRSFSLSDFYLSITHKETILGIPVDYGIKLNNRYYDVNLDDKFTDSESFAEYSPSLYVYGATVFEINNFLTIKPGFGFLGNFDENFSIVPSYEPRLQVLYRPDGTGRQEISVAAGRYSQVNSALTDELDAGTSFMALKPASYDRPIQTALHGIASYSRQMGAYTRLEIEGYIKEYSDISVSKFSPVARLEVETTRADGRAYGFDLVTRYQRSGMSASLGYGYSHVRYHADAGELGEFIGGEGVQSVLSYHPAQDQRHKLNAQLVYEIAGFDTAVRWQFGSGKPYTKVYGFDLGLEVPFEDPVTDPGTARTLYSQPYGGRLPAYHRLDISLKRVIRISDNTDLTTNAGAINVYDRDNVFYFDANSQQRVNQSPFMPYLSVSMNFR